VIGACKLTWSVNREDEPSACGENTSMVSSLSAGMMRARWYPQNASSDKKSRFSTLGTNRPSAPIGTNRSAPADLSTPPLLGGTSCRDRPWGGRAYQNRKVNTCLPRQFQRTLQNSSNFDSIFCFFYPNSCNLETFSSRVIQSSNR
jgi:hypothetical protein